MCELFKRESKLQMVLVMLAEREVSANRQPSQSVAPEALALKKVTALQERLL